MEGRLLHLWTDGTSAVCVSLFDCLCSMILFTPKDGKIACCLPVMVKILLLTYAELMFGLRSFIRGTETVEGWKPRDSCRFQVGFWTPDPWSVFSPLVHSMWGVDKQSSELSSQVSSLAANLRWTATTSVCVCDISCCCLECRVPPPPPVELGSRNDPSQPFLDAQPVQHTQNSLQLHPFGKQAAF